MIRRTKRLVDSFWSKIDRSGGPDVCWLWKTSKQPNRYAKFVLNSGKSIDAHRFAYFLANGRFAYPDTRHTCHVRGCCNPNHLLEGTRLENMRDMVNAGRSMKGERQPMSKLKEKDVRAIRQMRTKGVSQTKLARMFQIAKSTVQAIEHRRTWKHIS